GQRAVLEHVEIAERLVQALDLDHRLGRRGDGGRGGAVGRRGGGRGGAVGRRGGGRDGAAGRRGGGRGRGGVLARCGSTCWGRPAVGASGWCGTGFWLITAPPPGAGRAGWCGRG